MVTLNAARISETEPCAAGVRVPKGYKQTEAGVVPTDWLVRRVGDVCRLTNGRGFKPFEWRERGLPIIRIQNLNGSEEFNFFEGSYDRKLEIHQGQLLFAWSGNRGTSFGPHIWKGSFGLLNYHTWKVDADHNQVAANFFFHALKGLTKYIEGWAHGASALVHIQKWQMEEFQLAIPPTKAEQEAIARALSDADAMIESLEQTIAKKRQIKQGAMQDLLTRKKRLPGFSGAWDVALVADVADVKTGPFGSTLHERDYVQDGTPIITVEHLGEFGVMHRNLPMVSDADFNRLRAYQLEMGDIVFSRVGSVDRNGLIREAEVGWLFSGRLLRVRAQKTKAFAPYLSYHFHSDDFKRKIREVAVGQTMASLNTQILSNILIPLPAPPEQGAIASVLSDMDADIAALEEKLTKARQIKQGMMQELLTGKTRLI